MWVAMVNLRSSHRINPHCAIDPETGVVILGRNCRVNTWAALPAFANGHRETGTRDVSLSQTVCNWQAQAFNSRAELLNNQYRAFIKDFALKFLPKLSIMRGSKAQPEAYRRVAAEGWPYRRQGKAGVGMVVSHALHVAVQFLKIRNSECTAGAHPATLAPRICKPLETCPESER